MIVYIWLIICGCVCLWKGFHSSAKAKKFKVFLEDEDNICQAEAAIHIVKVEYHAYHKFDDYIVNINFTDFRGEKISISKTFNDSHCSTKYLRENKNREEFPATVFYHRENPEDISVKELNEFEYVRSERWIMPLVGVLFIFIGCILIYYRYCYKA